MKESNGVQTIGEGIKFDTVMPCAALIDGSRISEQFEMVRSKDIFYVDASNRNE